MLLAVTRGLRRRTQRDASAARLERRQHIRRHHQEHDTRGIVTAALQSGTLTDVACVLELQHKGSRPENMDSSEIHIK